MHQVIRNILNEHYLYLLFWFFVWFDFLFFYDFVRFIYTFLKSKYKKCSLKKFLITNCPMYTPLFQLNGHTIKGCNYARRIKHCPPSINLRARVKVSIQRKRNSVDAFVNPRNIHGSLYHWERGCQFKILEEILFLKVNKPFLFNMN